MIEKSQKGSVSVIQMNHGKVNALDLEFLLELNRVLEDEETTQSRALVLTGQAKAFSAGVDLHRIRSGGADYIDRFLPALIQTIKTLCLLKKTCGGGGELPCDRRRSHSRIGVRLSDHGQ